jgi:hypothetical protein
VAAAITAAICIAARRQSGAAHASTAKTADASTTKVSAATANPSAATTNVSAATVTTAVALRLRGDGKSGCC